MANREKRWLRLDNAALIFPAARRKHWSNVFRISFTFRDAVDSALLQQALEHVAPRFPSVCVRLRRGLFWYRLEEFYHDSRRMGRQLTDAEYAEQLEKLRGGRELTAVVADPSAASFIELLRRKGLPVVKADNDVLQGIRITADMLKSGRLAICEGCTDAIREFGLYCWNDRAQGRDEPLKVNDHAMDEIRYFAVFISGQNLSERFAATWVERQAADR